jgi:hypothetical protein
MPRDLAMIETEVELRDDHRSLTLGQPREEPTHFHSIERGLDLVLRLSRSGVIEAEQRSPEPAPPGTYRHNEEPPGKVIVLGRWLPQPSDEGVMKRVESAVWIAKNGKQGAIHARELKPIELLPSFRANRSRHHP